jgi:hypothetical protein
VGQFSQLSWPHALGTEKISRILTDPFMTFSCYHIRSVAHSSLLLV